MIRRLPLLLALAAGSCGYEVGNLYEIRDVKVDVFENNSERRTQEFDLTEAVVHEIASRGIRVNARDAAYTLKGKISEIRLQIIQLQDDSRVKILADLGDAETKMAEIYAETCYLAENIFLRLKH